MTYQTVKTLDHSRGISCIYREPGKPMRGHTVCVSVTLEADNLNNDGRVVSDASLEALCAVIKRALCNVLLVSQEDTDVDFLGSFAGMNIADVIILPGITFEHFAMYIFRETEHWLFDEEHGGRVRVYSAEISSQEGNAARFVRNF